jgi:O-antigen/teichoic acid export membrane protein
VNAIFGILGLVFIRKWFALPRSFHYVRKLLPIAIPYGVIAIISLVVPLYERISVTAQFGSYDLGLYAVGAKIASMVMLISAAFQMGWGPFSYSIYKEGNAARTYNLVLWLFTALICLLVLTISALAGPLIQLLAGDDYLDARIFVFPLALAFGVQAIGWITEIGIHLSKRTYLNLYGLTLLLVSSVVSITLLSQNIGIIGVALGALVGQILMASTSAVMAQRIYRMPWNYGLPLTSVAVTLATGVAAYLADLTEKGMPGSAIYVAGIVIVFTLNAVFGLTQADRHAFRTIVGARFPGARS